MKKKIANDMNINNHKFIYLCVHVFKITLLNTCKYLYKSDF